MSPIPYDHLQLLETPDLTPLPKPLIHSLCQEEIKSLLCSVRTIAVLKAKMGKRIQYWFENPEEAKKRKEWFEFVGHVEEGGVRYACYSLRFDRDRILGNLRILYIMDGSKMIMMCAFKETRNGSYDHAKDVVRTRLKEG